MFYVVLFQINNFIKTTFSENKTFLNKWLLNTWSYFALSCRGEITFILQFFIVLLERWKPKMIPIFFFKFLSWTIRKKILIFSSNFFFWRWIKRHKDLFLSLFLIEPLQVIVNKFNIFSFRSYVKILLGIFSRCKIRFIFH